MTNCSFSHTAFNGHLLHSFVTFGYVSVRATSSPKLEISARFLNIPMTRMIEPTIMINFNKVIKGLFFCPVAGSYLSLFIFAIALLWAALRVSRPPVCSLTSFCTYSYPLSLSICVTFASRASAIMLDAPSSSGFFVLLFLPPAFKVGL